MYMSVSWQSLAGNPAGTTELIFYILCWSIDLIHIAPASHLHVLCSSAYIPIK